MKLHKLHKLYTYMYKMAKSFQIKSRRLKLKCKTKSKKKTHLQGYFL